MRSAGRSTEVTSESMFVSSASADNGIDVRLIGIVSPPLR